MACLVEDLLLNSPHMFARVVPFLAALVLLFAGALASSHAVQPAAGHGHPLQELVSGDEQRADQGQTQPETGTVMDVPDLLFGPLALPSAALAMPGLQPQAPADRAHPYLNRPLRPPCGAGLLA